MNPMFFTSHIKSFTIQLQKKNHAVSLQYKLSSHFIETLRFPLLQFFQLKTIHNQPKIYCLLLNCFIGQLDGEILSQKKKIVHTKDV